MPQEFSGPVPAIPTPGRAAAAQSTNRALPRSPQTPTHQREPTVLASSNTTLRKEKAPPLLREPDAQEVPISPAHTRSGHSYSQAANTPKPTNGGSPTSSGSSNSSPATSPEIPMQTTSYVALVHTHRAPDRKETWRVEIVDEPTTLLIGTSNISRITRTPSKAIELHSFPGAKFHHLETMLKKSPTMTGPKRVLIAMGVNDTSVREGQRPTRLNTVIESMRKAVKQARSKFPGSSIYVAEINMSATAAQTSRDRTDTLNREIRSLEGVHIIPALPKEQVELTPYDLVHWTTNTANKILKHWAHHLN